MPSIDYPEGAVVEVAYPLFMASLHIASRQRLRFVIAEGPFAREEEVATEVVDLAPGIFAVSWQEADGATVVNVHDWNSDTVQGFVTLANGSFLRMAGRIARRAGDGSLRPEQ